MMPLGFPKNSAPAIPGAASPYEHGCSPVPKETLYSHPLANTFESLSHRLKELALTLRPRRLGRITPTEVRSALINHVQTHLPHIPWQPIFGSQQEYEQLQSSALSMTPDTEAQQLLQMSAKA